MFKPQQHFSTTKTPQTEPTPGKTQVKMASGGYGFAVDDWVRLDRFLILGSEGGSYYATERELTKSNAEAVLRCIKADGHRVVLRATEVSVSGRAPKNDPALFVLAMCAKLGGDVTKHAAYVALPKVARIGTHLFHFCEYAKAFGGLGGNGFKRALGRFYDRHPRTVALQAVKYQGRDGWSHRDVLRLAHLKPATADHDSIYRYIVKGRQKDLGPVEDVPENLKLIWAVERAKELKKGQEQTLVNLITDFRLPHECVPNEFKSDKRVWDALLQDMPPGAMIRNLNKMTQVGLLDNMGEAMKLVRSRLADIELLKRARLHPMTVLIGMVTYGAGQGYRGKMRWSPVPNVLNALNDAFYLAFGTVVPTGKRTLVALDVSGSMCAPTHGVPFLQCRVAACVMALVTMNVEPQHEVIGFTGDPERRGGYGLRYRGGGGVARLQFSPTQRLDDVARATEGLPFGPTDCALPFVWAQEQNLEFDAVVTYTDNESWAGPVHVHQAIDTYRQKTGLPVKSVVVAMAANDYSVANPDDAGQMDCIGLDTATPNVISNFIRGE